MLLHSGAVEYFTPIAKWERSGLDLIYFSFVLAVAGFPECWGSVLGGVVGQVLQCHIPTRPFSLPLEIDTFLQEWLKQEPHV